MEKYDALDGLHLKALLQQIARIRQLASGHPARSPVIAWGDPAIKYIAWLNSQYWDKLGHFVHQNVKHNGRPLGLSGYQRMLESDYEQIPNLQFQIELLVVEPPRLAARLRFNVSPKGDFLGVPVNGRTVTFAENVFYEFRNGLINEVLSVIDKVAIESQLS